jgi:two-component system cell cycle response regulator DivK
MSRSKHRNRETSPCSKPLLIKMPGYILIADDYEDNRELLRLILEDAGYTVREAADGGECVSLAQTEPPLAALIDISMPVLDGWKVIEELRADERTRGIPCVAVTAFTADADRQRTLAAGFTDFLGKPYRAKDLLAIIERVTHEKQSG